MRGQMPFEVGAVCQSIAVRVGAHTLETVDTLPIFEGTAGGPALAEEAGQPRVRTLRGSAE